MYRISWICSILLLAWLDYSQGKKVCYKEIGCFETGGDFSHPVYRPIDLVPQPREVINTKFSLYTKNNLKEPYILQADKKEGLKQSPIDPEKITRFIVHGFLDTELFGKWQEEMKNELLLNSEINCVIVDWSGGNKPPYAQATSNTRVVGAEIALLIKALVETLGMSTMKMHIIGHSLGSHIAGYAGERTKKLGRITALDPAEPYFQHMPTSVRIDPTDADFIDVIHSDAKTILLMGLGMEQQVGHIDFYPNNGRDQPGCKSSKFSSFILSGLVEGARRFVSCNHQRAIDFFLSTLNYKACTPVGIECKDWETFLEGKCTECGPKGDKCGIMGIRGYEFYPHKSNKKQVKVFLKTSSKKPYCLFHYSIEVRLHNAKKSKDVAGKIKVTLNGEKEDVDVKLSAKDEKFYHGSTYRYLYTTPTNIGSVRSIAMRWEHDKTLNPLTWGILRKPSLYVEYIKVTPLNYVDMKERSKQIKKFCYGAEKPVESKTSVTFIGC